MAAEAVELLLGEGEGMEHNDKESKDMASADTGLDHASWLTSSSLDDEDVDMRHEFRIFGGVSILLNCLQKTVDEVLIQAILQLITVAAEVK